jgi:hypothetical protein
MKFTELRQEIDENLSEINSFADYQRVYFSSGIQAQINGLGGKYVEHLFNDLIEHQSTLDIKKYLGGSSYNNANEYAKSCVHTVIRSRDIYGHKLAGWTDAALKCFDNLLLVFIQEKLNEIIEDRGKFGKGGERNKYWHLIEKGEPMYHIGIGFDTVYQVRNEFTHVEVVDSADGKRYQRQISSKQLKRMKAIILESISMALSQFEKTALETWDSTNSTV